MGSNVIRTRYDEGTESTEVATSATVRCDSSDIDDEKHFLFSCSHLNEERKKLYDEINLCCSNFSQLNPTDKLIWLMAVDNPDMLTRISNMVQKANV
jgi:hypothetical protein